MNDAQRRAIAIAKGMRTYTPANPCAKGHESDRFTSEGKCVQCCRERDNKRYDSRRAEKRQYDREYYQDNKDHLIKKAYAWAEENRSAKNAIALNYYRNNMGKCLALVRKRQAAAKQAIPSCITDDQLAAIEVIYVKAAKMNRRGLVKYHVDHIVPLRGKVVRGLHVPWNLQIITASENVRKSNKFIDG